MRPDLPELRERRAELLRAAADLKQADGTFSDPERFDTLMEHVESLDAVLGGGATRAQRDMVIRGLEARDMSTRTDPICPPVDAHDYEATRDHRASGGGGVMPEVAVMAEALAARLGGPAASGDARAFRRTRLPQIVGHLLERRGVSTRGMGDAWVVTRAMHTTSDFPSLLTETGNRLLRHGYEAYTGGLTRIARQVTAPDFRAINRLQLGEAPALLKVNEHGEVKSGTMAESKETYKLSTYARIFSLSRNAIINDDLGAFAQFAQRQGRAAAELIASELATLLTSNPTMGDGTALFHADHDNVGSAAAIDIDSLGEALKLLRLQKGLDGSTPIDVTPKYLVVPAALEVVGRQNVALVKRDRWGQHHQTPRDESEWIRVSAPQLQIVSDELWTAAHERIAAQRFSTNIKSRVSDSKYLLPGLARCTSCEGGLFVQKRTRTNREASLFYGCTSFHQRGRSVCHNDMRLPMADVDEAVMRRIQNIVTRDLVDEVLATVRADFDPDGRDERRQQLERQLRTLEEQVTRLAEAIALGGDVPALVARLRQAEDRRQALTQQLDGLTEGSACSPPDWGVLEAQAREWLADWRRLLAHHPAEARPVLRELLEGPIRFTKTARGARFEGAVAIGGMLAGCVPVFQQQQWRPRADSNCRPTV